MKKNCVLLLIPALMLSATLATAEQIVTERKEVGGDTVIYCSPNDRGEHISRAYITIYQNPEGVAPVVREEMEVSSVEGRASFVVPGRYSAISGRCRMLVDSDQSPAGVTPLAEDSKRILNQEFFFVSR